jgi:hypothetical protein
MCFPDCSTVIQCAPGIVVGAPKHLVSAPKYVAGADRHCATTPSCSQGCSSRSETVCWHTQVFPGAPEAHCIGQVNPEI